MTKLRVGVDVGGTFTDVVAMDENGTIRFAKTPSTPEDQSVGVLNGIEKILEVFGADPSDVTQIVHGTTVATNALLERKGAPTALITTTGFRDVLHIGRQDRPKLYDLTAARPEPLVARRFRREVDGRIDPAGHEVAPLDEAALRDIVRELLGQGIEAVAVCLLHSYANPAHEQRAVEIIREMAPEMRISASHEILPEFREFERVSTTVINAYVHGAMKRYLDRLTGRLKEANVTAPLMVMQSNGGMMSARAAAERAVNTLLSGPAGGVLASSFLSETVETSDFVTADVGGTSFDVALVENGTPAVRTEGTAEGFAIKFPHIDIHTIGSGGGSIAWIDAGGGLRVGPKSAGAKPGPICYSRGGTEPTVCDAFAVLGWLGESSLLGGDMTLDVAGARAAIEEKIAKPLGLGVEEAAEGILKVAKAAMCRAVHLITVERGQDLRRFTLLPYGGAGPLHASDIAHELGMANVMVPVAPGNFSAFGVLAAPILYDEVATCARLLDDTLDLADLETRYNEIETRLAANLRAEGCRAEDIVWQRKADLRYQGQAYELTIEVPTGRLDAAATDEVVKSYHALHRRMYGFDRPDACIELVNIRAVGTVPSARNGFGGTAGATGAVTERGRRQVYIQGRWWDAPIWWRLDLSTGSTLEGPAVIEEAGSTFVLFPGDSLTVNAHGVMKVTTAAASKFREVA